MNATLKDCIIEWLRTTQRTTWEVFNDGSDLWLQYLAVNNAKETTAIPHYLIQDEVSKVVVCCPADHNDRWEVSASDPNFFDFLAGKMAADEDRVCRNR